MSILIKPFDDSQQKDRRKPSTVHSNTSTFDAYRQGVELTKSSDYASGIAKIHNGNNDQDGQHDALQVVYGQIKNKLNDNKFFEDGSIINPLSRF